MTKIKSARRKAPSVHSRAARRATSPGIDTDKSLKTAKPPPESVNARPAVLAHHGGGITKKTKQGRKSVLSSKARKRQLKAMDRAEAVLDKTVSKTQRSKGQGKVVQSRKKTWDEINKRLRSDGENKKAGPQTMDEEDNTNTETETDEEMDTQSEAAEPLAITSDASLPAQEVVEGEDEIL